MSSIYKSLAGEQAVRTLYDGVLTHWPVPHETRTVPTRHGDTFVIASGDAAAPSLVLLHGAGTNSAMWAGDVAAYAERFRVYAVDLIGEPGRSAPSRPSWEGPPYAEWLADVLDGLAVDAATIIGLSQGAWCALKLAVAQPTRVRQLVLLSPGGIVHDKLSFVVRVLPLLFLGRWGIRRVNDIILAGRAVPPAVDDAMTTMTTHFRARIGALPLFSDTELARLTMPVLVLVGSRDALRDGKKIADRMRTLVPRLTATIVPDGGHALLDVTAPILAFLNEHADTG